MREWESWVPAETREDVEVPGVGRVEVHHDLREVDGNLVTFDTHFRFDDGTTAAEPSTLRFMTRDELAAFLDRAGFADIAWHGGWDGSPLGSASPEIIAVAIKAA